MLRVVDELLWRLRRDGLAIPTSSAIDAVRAVRLVGLEDRAVVRATLACALVKSKEDARVFAKTFDAFFARAPTRTLRERLAARGFSDTEIQAALDAMATLDDAANLEAFLDHGSELDRALSLAGMQRALASLVGPLQRGFYTHRALERAGAGAAWRSLATLRAALRDALGARADALVAALAQELEAGEDVVRQRVDVRAQRPPLPSRGPVLERSLGTLDAQERAEVRRAVRELSTRLRGAARVRKKRARRGRIDPHRTLRRTLRTLGVPMDPAHARRRRDKPRLVILCDVSDSVRDVSALLLEFVHSAHELFEATRSFVFVGELGEITGMFRDAKADAAIDAAQRGAVVPVTGNSNYGRALRAFVERHLEVVDRRTTVVVLGDGRTNYLDPGADALERIRSRAKALLWICPEPRERWAEGDSAMARYAEVCTEVHEVRTARDLERAARAITARR
jgi:uncharacterized protein with von Willebrand factor type A (vWA) domain